MPVGSTPAGDEREALPLDAYADVIANLDTSPPADGPPPGAVVPTQDDAAPLARGQIMRIASFDMELEGWLRGLSWWVRRNQLSGEMEIHLPNGVIPMSDERLAEVRFKLEYASNGKEPAKDRIADAVALIAERNAYHPVIEYLDALEWDGIKRLDTWLINYAGADDTELNRAFSRKTLCAAVRRVKQPGCKFDHILVLQGAQDLGKSSLIRALCHDDRWFTDQVKVGTEAKETIEKTSGAWIAELAELDGLGRREANAVKSFITTVEDRARPAYGRFAVTKPRQIVLFGTTNEAEFLSDPTGNRRWWVVRVSALDVAGLMAARDQLWAEAVVAEMGERLWLDTPELKTAAATVAKTVMDRGAYYDLLVGKVPEGPVKIVAADAWALVGIKPDDVNRITPASRTALRKAMAGLNFDPETKVLRYNGRSVKAFVRGDLHEAEWWSPSEGLQRSTIRFEDLP